MNTRLQQFLAAENISQAQFAEYIGVARASVSHIVAGRNKPSYEFITSTMLHYPNLNMDWLLTGRGKMYKGADSVPTLNIFDEPEIKEENGAEEDLPLFESTEDTPVEEPKIAPTTSIVTSKEKIQLPINQRKAVKIIVLYDDNSFQEL